MDFFNLYCIYFISFAIAVLFFASIIAFIIESDIFSFFISLLTLFIICSPFFYQLRVYELESNEYKIETYDIAKISKDKYFDKKYDEIKILTKSGKYLTFDDENVEIFKSDVNKANVKLYKLQYKSKLKLYLKDSDTNYKKFEPNGDSKNEK